MFDKDYYKKEERVEIYGETAVKPYYYMRNGLLHVRYTVDRCIELSGAEAQRIKGEIDGHPEQKQNVFSKYWNLLTVMAERKIHFDGIRKGEERMKELSRKYGNNGYGNNRYGYEDSRSRV